LAKTTRTGAGAALLRPALTTDAGARAAVLGPRTDARAAGAKAEWCRAVPERCGAAMMPVTSAPDARTAPNLATRPAVESIAEEPATSAIDALARDPPRSGSTQRASG
jgi:hypothetical protein